MHKESSLGGLRQIGQEWLCQSRHLISSLRRQWFCHRETDETILAIAAGRLITLFRNGRYLGIGQAESAYFPYLPTVSVKSCESILSMQQLFLSSGTSGKCDPLAGGKYHGQEKYYTMNAQLKLGICLPFTTILVKTLLEV